MEDNIAEEDSTVVEVDTVEVDNIAAEEDSFVVEEDIVEVDNTVAEEDSFVVEVDNIVVVGIVAVAEGDNVVAAVGVEVEIFVAVVEVVESFVGHFGFGNYCKDRNH